MHSSTRVTAAAHRWAGVRQPQAGGGYAVALALVVGVHGAPETAHGQGAGGQQPAFHLLRQEEEWGPRTPVGLKYLPLGQSRDSYLYFGGDVRLEAERHVNRTFGANPGSDGIVTTRTLLHSGLVLGEHLRFFGELQHAGVFGSRFRISLADEDTLDLQQAFAELRFGDVIGGRSGDALVRAGRQELHYGAGRLISVREGPNARLSYDGVLARTRLAGWTIDGFGVAPVRTKPGIFDNGLDEREALWGVYARGPVAGRHGLDAYYIGYEREGSAFVQGTGTEHRHSLGARWWHVSPTFTADLEATYQFGTFAAGARADIGAWSVSSSLRYRFPDLPLQPTLGVEWGMSSGDRDPGDGVLGTFRAPHPPGRLFGEANDLGPGNLAGFRPFVVVAPTPKLAIEPRAQFFWRLDARDGIYATSGALLRLPGSSRASFIGWEAGVIATYTFSGHFSVAGTVARFFAGPFLEDTGRGEDTTFVGTALRIRF